MKSIFTRPKAGAQSQGRDRLPSISSIATPLLNPRTSPFARKKGAHRTLPHSSTSKAMPTMEYELSQQLQEKEDEIQKVRAYYEGKASQKEHEIKTLHHDQVIMREALEKKDNDMLELSSGFKGTLDEKDKELGELRKCYDRLLHGQESQHRNSDIEILQQEDGREAGALRQKLATAEQELDLCRDDLFRMQPVCKFSDRNIIADFESLSEQLTNWIDNETSAFEKANPDADVGCLFSGSEDPDVELFLQTHPSAGEYLCGHMVNHYLLDYMFGPNIHLLGLSAEYTQMRLTIEHGMAALKPPRDFHTVNIWRAETLSALAATQEFIDLREEQIIQWTPYLFENLSASFPNLFGRKEAMNGFHEQVTVPATTIVSKLQGLASAYRLDMVSKKLLDSERFTRDDLQKVIAVDLRTGKILKSGSAVVLDGEGFIGNFVLPLEPSLHRVNEGARDTDLRQETWLVKLDHALGSQAHKASVFMESAFAA